ncbi:hypothetical protein JCM11641_006931 [Rhodosporidiobolus odoratus]
MSAAPDSTSSAAQASREYRSTSQTSVSQHSPNSLDKVETPGEGVDTAGKPDAVNEEVQKMSWREKMPGSLKGPLDALFPHFTPSPLYPATPPAFLLSAQSRTAWRSRKHLLRSMLVLLASFILVLNPDSLTVLGQASFFGMIVSVMLPPTFPAQVFLLVATTLVLGMCVGWAWGCAAMAAALRARDRVLLASSVRRVQNGIAGATNPDSEYRLAIFQGEFLDARSTVVFGVFFWIGLFALGFLRAKGPQATFLLAIFGSIVMDVMCSYGPLFPIAQYTLATTFLIPTACFLAIAIASNLLIFPESLNSTWTVDLVDKVLSPILQRSQLHSKLLSTPPPAFHGVADGTSTLSTKEERSNASASAWPTFSSLFASTQAAASSGLEALLTSVPMLEMELSYGRTSSSDLKGLVDTLREVHVRSVGLGVLFATVESRYKRYQSLRKLPSADTSRPPTSSSSAKTETSTSAAKPAATYAETDRMRRTRERFTRAEQVNNHDLGSLLPIFRQASSELRHATDSALEGAMIWLVEQNSMRWSGFLPFRFRAPQDRAEQRTAEQKTKMDRLEAVLEQYRTDGRQALIGPFVGLFDPVTGQLLATVAHPRDLPKPVVNDDSSPTLAFAPGSLFTLLAASDNLVVFAQAVLAFGKKVGELQEKRRENRVWWPTGLRKVGNLLLVKGNGEGGGKINGDGEDPDRVEIVPDGAGKGEQGDKGKEAKGEFGEKGLDPDARPPKNAVQRFTFTIYRLGRFLTSPEGLFALKYATFSILIWLPQVFKSASYIMYSEKSLWCLITLQTFLAVYAGDQILASLQKVVGIAVGLVYGMFLWYLGSADGPGSPYGLGAAVFVFMLPVMAIRIFAPPASSQAAIQAAVTAILIVGYSWQDSHLPSVGNPGIGYTLAWKRALLVLIGTGIAAVAMLLPPVSTRLLVRRTHATCIHELGRLYTLIISAWLKEEHSLPDSTVEATSSGFSPAAREAARARMLAVRVKLNATQPAILQASWEISLRGDWPKEEHSQLLTLQLGMLQALAQLGQALVRLSPEWRRALVHETAFLNQPLIADVTSTFSLLSLALRQGSPLPQATPGPLLDRLLYHDRRLRLLSGPSASSASSPSSSVNPARPELEGAQLSSSPLTLLALQDERFGIYASALQALASVLLDLDELEKVTKTLVGEIGFPGYDRLARDESVFARV